MPWGLDGSLVPRSYLGAERLQGPCEQRRKNADKEIRTGVFVP